MSEQKEVRILVGHRGWVFVGEYSATPTEVTLERAKCIRRWGTRDKGIGVLRDGPTSETVLDAAGTVRMHPLAVIATIDCDAEKWRARLG